MSKNASRLRVGGTVRDSETGRAIVGVRVRAYDKDFFRDQLLGDGDTDANGRYEIVVDPDDLTGPNLRLERRPDLFLIVLDATGQQIWSTERSVIVDAGRRTTIDLQIPYFPRHSGEPGLVSLFGTPVDIQQAAGLTAQEIVEAYRLVHGGAATERAKRFERIFPSIFGTRTTVAPECGNGIRDLFAYLLQERNAVHLLADADADPYSGATVHRFFTANIVVTYTTDATLPGGTANPNQLPAGSATIPAADAAYAMPNGTVIGTVRAHQADLDPANTEVAPTYIQKVGLLAEYALSHYINPPFSYRDPRGGLSRLEFRILGLPAGVAGYAVPSDFHMELNISNSDGQNLGTVPHELFHLVQYRYNAGGDVAGGVRQITLEGGARLLEESINETPNRYVESAIDPDLSASTVARKGILTFPGESLLDVAGPSMLRYAAGLLWKYFAEQHSTHAGAGDEPAIGVDAYRRLIERMVTTADGFTVAALRNGRAQLPWYGTFDQFSYYDAAATELNSHESTWGNFLVANYVHRLQTPGAVGFDRRFNYLEDEDPPGNVASLSNFGAAVSAGNVLSVSQGTAVTLTTLGHKPYAAVYYELNPGAPAPRMVRINVTTSAGMSDPLIQILRIGPSNLLVDVHRSDRTAWSKTIAMAGLTKVVVIVGSRQNGGDVTVTVDEVAASTDVMITRWNTAVGTEFEIDPAGWSWAWISPDIMVDTDNDLADDVKVVFGQNNTLKVRLRNRGNADATNIQVRLHYQKATPYLTTAGWIPVQNTAGVTQHLSGLSLAARAEAWFGVDWAPVDDGTHHNHWCIKATVTVPGDPNLDNKMAFRNFSNVVVAGPDSSFDAMIRHAQWRSDDRVLIVPRGPRANLEIVDPEILPSTQPTGCDPDGGSSRVILGDPLRASFIRLRVAAPVVSLWDGTSTADPADSSSYYPVDRRSLPPGIHPDDVVTVAHLRGGRPFGGVSYLLRDHDNPGAGSGPA